MIKLPIIPNSPNSKISFRKKVYLSNIHPVAPKITYRQTNEDNLLTSFLPIEEVRANIAMQKGILPLVTEFKIRFQPNIKNLKIKIQVLFPLKIDTFVL